MSLNEQPRTPWKRTIFRGFLGGLLVYWVLIFLLAYVGAEVTGYIAQANGQVSPLEDGPFRPLTLGWLLQLPLILGVAFASGLASARLGPMGSLVAPLVLVALHGVLGGLSIVQSRNFFDLVLLLATLVGVMLGATYYRHALESRGA